MADPEVTPDGGAPAVDVPAVVEPAAPAVTQPEAPSLLTEAHPAELAPEPETPAAPETPVAEEPAAPAVTPEPIAAPEPEPIVYEAFEAPEGLTLDQERITAIDEKLASARVSPELRADLYNEHIAEMRRLDEHYQREQWRVFNDQQRAEKEKVQADPELWRPGLELPDQPAIAACVRMLDEFVPPAQRADWDQMMTNTGVGNQHIFIKFLHNLAKKFDAPATPLAPTNPPPDRGRNPAAKGRLRQFYDAPSSRRQA